MAGIPLSVNGLVIALVQNRRWRSGLFVISGPFVSVDIRRWPAAPDTAVAVVAAAPGPPPGSITPVRSIAVVTAVASVRRITVVTAIASVWRITVMTAIAAITIAPLDILAFDVATFINEAWSAVDWAVAVGRVAATVGTGIVGSVIVASLRRCCDHRRTEQYQDARDDQCQSAAGRRASGNSTVHCKLQHAHADRAT